MSNNMVHNPYAEIANAPERPLAEQIEQETKQSAEEKKIVVTFGTSNTTELATYLWFPYIPRKQLTVLCAKQGTGKGYVAAAIGSEITNGKRPFDTQPKKPENILVISSEETNAEIERKYKYSGACMDRVGRIGRENATDADGRSIFNISERPQELENIIKEHHAGLVIIDPIQDFIGVKNLNAAEEVSAALIKLSRIADKCDCSIVYMAHTSKKDYDGDLLSRVAGSSEFTRKPRSALFIEYDETGTKPNRRVIVHAKKNGTVEGNAFAIEINTVDEDLITEQIAEDSALPAYAKIVGLSNITTSIVEAAKQHRKKLHEYLAEHPLEISDNLTQAAETLANLAEKIGTPLYLSRAGLYNHFPHIFSGNFADMALKVKPHLFIRGYTSTYTTPMGKGRKDYYGYENQRTIKIEKR